MPEELFKMIDDSAQVTVKVFREKTSAAHRHDEVSCELEDESMVVIGGGATGSGYPGGLLTASFPRPDRKAWVASSKDHGAADEHDLSVFAIGLSIQGLSPERLKSFITYEETTTPTRVSYPVGTATRRDGASTLVGGGFRLNMEQTAPGNLITSSYPEFDQSWTARGKDHGAQSKATMTTWGIYMKKEIDIGIANLKYQVNVLPTTGFSDPSGNHSATAFIPKGFAMVGCGAEVQLTYGNIGQLIYQIEPAHFPASPSDNTPERWGVVAASKDHAGHASKDSLKTWAIGIRLQQIAGP
ncbi:hypothetical protein [Streptomyces sp. WAC06614]|uniref:hypothetical protein n=1 Tax=Streptomyces sp. WAC06614 TaxID=2487416 RepID=UPI000F7B26C9|nr:hypothetical protein [Streptomyces sp. WAC06614]RSS60787.1 hypothetical protein EF918_32530 [Streptomyces sp. WAC06614]